MVRARSAATSSPTRTWPSVSRNGRRASSASSSPPDTGLRGTAGIAAADSRRPGQLDLEHEGLLEPEAVPGPFGVLA